MSKRSTAFNIEALSRIDSRDMLVLQDTSGKVMADLSKFYATDSSEAVKLEAETRMSLELAYGYDSPQEEDRKPFVYQDGVAVIPIHGTLLNRCNWSWGFITGYQYVRRMLNAALDDDDVELIVFDVDSPGGEAAGCFELAREIMASRRVKPSLAMVDSTAASGGVALAVCATSVYAIPSARIGSIGVYKMHVSFEENLKNAGIKVTFASAGEHKVDGNQYQDLPASVLNEWRESAGKTWDDFIALVAEARDLSEDEVRATQARIYRADEALDKGLIDAVKTPTEAVAAFLAEQAEVIPSFNDEEENTMADVKGKEVTSGLTENDLAQIKSMVSGIVGTALTSFAGGLNRVQQIKDHGASKNQVALATKLAANDAISAEDAIELIDAAAGNAPAPKAKAKAPKGKQKVQAADEGDEDEDGDADEGNEDGEGDEDEDGEGEDDAESARSTRKGKDRVNHFDRAMARSDHPNAGGGKSKGDKDGNGGGGSKANALLADHARVTGADWSSKASSKH